MSGAIIYWEAKCSVGFCSGEDLGTNYYKRWFLHKSSQVMQIVCESEREERTLTHHHHRATQLNALNVANRSTTSSCMLS